MHVQRQLQVSRTSGVPGAGSSRGPVSVMRPVADEEEQRLVARMLDLVAEHPRYGYRRIWALLRQEGWRVNRKRVYRLWRQEGLQSAAKAAKKAAFGHSDNSCVGGSGRAQGPRVDLGLHLTIARPLAGR